MKFEKSNVYDKGLANGIYTFCRKIEDLASLMYVPIGATLNMRDRGINVRKSARQKSTIIQLKDITLLSPPITFIQMPMV